MYQVRGVEAAFCKRSAKDPWPSLVPVAMSNAYASNGGAKNRMCLQAQNNYLFARFFVKTLFFHMYFHLLMRAFLCNVNSTVKMRFL